MNISGMMVLVKVVIIQIAGEITIKFLISAHVVSATTGGSYATVALKENAFPVNLAVFHTWTWIVVVDVN